MKHSMVYFTIILLPFLALAQGRIIIPELPPQVDPGSVYLKSVETNVDLKQNLANVRIEQTFQNNSSLMLEGEYLFPLAGDAHIYDFYLYINGKKTKGALLDSREALTIYENIVRRVKDPALLEYAGYGLFKARIFPILPKKDRTIELSYAQTLETEGDMVRFTLPIRQSGQGAIEDFHLTIKLEPGYPISQIYSPSHQVEVVRDGESRATITCEAKNLEGHKDFILYYSESKNEIDATLLTFRPRTDRDGFFMFMAKPGQLVRHVAIPKDVIFVIDVSGSMGGEKIRQAKAALHHCLNTLNPRDRFEVISFSSSIRPFQGILNEVNSETMKNVRYYVDNLSATGGTNIESAFSEALRIKKKEDERPTSIVFLTDGLPTEGETDIVSLLKIISGKQSHSFRIFNFGVGYDVNTFLLDKLALDSGGSTTYVKPGEDIEKQVSILFAKITSPVLADPELNISTSDLSDMYPVKLPNLYEGEKVVVFGRYGKAGTIKIELSGEQENQHRSYEYNVEFSAREEENDFIAHLWANRKVFHLIDRIRFEGESEELIQSVKNLASEYGIVTPYTSYLVKDEQMELAQRMGQAAAEGLEKSDRLLSRYSARKSTAAGSADDVVSEEFLESISAAPMSAQQSTGRGAVTTSSNMKKISKMEQKREMLVTVRRVSGRTFNLRDGIWIEHDLTQNVVADHVIKYLSDPYFNMLRKHPDLKMVFALGDKILFRWNGEVFRIK